MWNGIKSGVFSQYALVLVTSWALLAMGTGILLETDVTVDALSPLAVGCSGAYGLAIGISQHVDAVERVFDRGQNIINGLTIFFVLLVVNGAFGDPLRVLTACTFGVGFGTIAGLSLFHQRAGGEPSPA